MVSGPCSGQARVTSVLLATAIVKIRNSAGSEVSGRALLDSGSQASFITEGMAEVMMLDMRKGPVTISTLGTGQQQKTKGLLSTALDDSVRANLPRITGSMPSSPIDKSEMRHVDNLLLADPKFNLPARLTFFWARTSLRR